MTEYKTKEACESAIKTINGCINALNEEPGLAYKLGSLTLEHTVKYLTEYRKMVEKDLVKITKRSVNPGTSAADHGEITKDDVKIKGLPDVEKAINQASKFHMAWIPLYYNLSNKTVSASEKPGFALITRLNVNVFADGDKPLGKEVQFCIDRWLNS